MGQEHPQRHDQQAKAEVERRTTRSARSSSRAAEARTPPTPSSARPVVCFAIASRSSGLDATWRRACCVSSLASTLSVSSSGRGARQCGPHEALQLTACSELGRDAFEYAVADERVLGQRAGERSVDKSGDLGCRQNLVNRVFDWSSPDAGRRLRRDQSACDCCAAARWRGVRLRTVRREDRAAGHDR